MWGACCLSLYIYIFTHECIYAFTEHWTFKMVFHFIDHDSRLLINFLRNLQLCFCHHLDKAKISLTFIPRDLATGKSLWNLIPAPIFKFFLENSKVACTAHKNKIQGVCCLFENLSWSPEPYMCMINSVSIHYNCWESSPQSCQKVCHEPMTHE